MENDIFYEQMVISNKTLNHFEAMYQEKQNEIIRDLKKIMKEKYNIDIIDNESTNSKCSGRSNEQ